MKVLVTGGAGFIGSHVVDALLDKGFEVAVVDDLSTGKQQNVNPKATFYRMDVCDPRLAEVFDKERPQCVNHHAAQANVPRSVADPLHDARVNVLGSLNLIENCRKHGVKKIVYISSGGIMYGEPEYLPCGEEHEVRPLCQYGVSKHTVEHYLFAYRHNYGLDYTALRYGNVYGPRQDPLGEAGVVAIFTGQMLRGQPVTINGSGQQERDFVYIGDIVRANLLALERGGGQIFNIGWGIGTSVNELFRRLKELTGYQREPFYGPPKTGEIFKIYLDSHKAREILGWQPTIDLQSGLAKTVEYFRAVLSAQSGQQEHRS